MAVVRCTRNYTLAEKYSQRLSSCLNLLQISRGSAHCMVVYNFKVLLACSLTTTYVASNHSNCSCYLYSLNRTQSVKQCLDA